MNKYLVIATYGECVNTVEMTSDLTDALALCKQLNIESEMDMPYGGPKYFVVRDSDGQTWIYKSGLMFRVDFIPEAARFTYKEIAI